MGINLVMSQEAPMQPASKSEAAHANYANPTEQPLVVCVQDDKAKLSIFVFLLSCKAAFGQFSYVMVETYVVAVMARSILIKSYRRKQMSLLRGVTLYEAVLETVVYAVG